MPRERLQSIAYLLTTLGLLVSVVSTIMGRREDRARYDAVTADLKKSVELNEATMKLLHQCVDSKTPAPSP